MKKLLALTLSTAFIGLAYAADEAWTSRELRSRQATTTASPNYADDELQREEASKNLEVRTENERKDMSSDSQRGSEWDGNDMNTRTYKARHSDSTTRDY